MDLRQPGIHARVARDGAVGVREPEVSPDGVHHRVHRGVHQAGLSQLADAELDAGALHPDQRVQAVGLTPGEPAPSCVRLSEDGWNGRAVPELPVVDTIASCDDSLRPVDARRQRDEALTQAR